MDWPATEFTRSSRIRIPNQRSTSEVILDLYEDSSGTIWAGTGNGLLRLRETDTDVQFEHVSLGEQSNEELDITTIVEDSPGVLWLGTETGLFRRHSDGKVERFTTKNGLPHDHIRDILRDPDGIIWIATGLGLCRLKSDIRAGDQIVSRLYTKKDGMLSEGNVGLESTVRRRSRTAVVGAGNQRAFSVSGFAIVGRLFQSSSYQTHTSREGLSGNEPFRLFEDSRGDLWISIISTPSQAYLNRWERATDKIHSYPQSIASRTCER